MMYIARIERKNLRLTDYFKDIYYQDIVLVSLDTSGEKDLGKTCLRVQQLYKALEQKICTSDSLLCRCLL